MKLIKLCPFVLLHAVYCTTSLPARETGSQSDSTLEEANAAVYPRLPTHLRACVLSEFLADEVHTIAATSKAAIKELDEFRLYQKNLAKAYLMPAIADIPYHRDLQLLDGVSFEDTENGRIAAAMHLFNVLSSQLTLSPVRAGLTVVLFEAILTQSPYIHNHEQIFKIFEHVNGFPSHLSFYLFALEVLLNAGKCDLASQWLEIIEKRSPGHVFSWCKLDLRDIFDVNPRLFVGFFE